jgi:hypothetical protein
VTDFIICPNCGKKVICKQCLTRKKLFFCYKICSNCGCNFTKLIDHTKFHTIIYFIVLFLLGIGDLLISVLSEKLVHMSFIIMFSAAILGFTVYLIQQRRYVENLNKSTNGFLVIIENKSQDRIIKYAREDTLSEAELRLKFDTIEKNNIIVLLPHYNVKMLLNYKINFCKLKINHFYKLTVNKAECFCVLTDIKEENDFILYLKFFDTGEKVNNQNEYDLLTIDDEIIGKVRRTE